MKIATTFEAIILCVLSSVLGVCVGIIAMFLFSIQPMKKEAVERGFATWQVVDNSNGATKFTWNKSKQMEEEVEEMFANIEKPLDQPIGTIRY